ncbi:hypothetical protein SAY87_013111 [Trapa incisa]|uniref:Uncharacterized protein n=1 Tax=Trapa incisa TaxID=236973 RepID=A0AAN7KFU1_9MYRT|nr:hypothetical protein SAY87_013111 [Trapa incisa]
MRSGSMAAPQSESFSSLKESASAKSKKKKKMSLILFNFYNFTGIGSSSASKGITPDEMLRLPTGHKGRGPLRNCSTGGLSEASTRTDAVIRPEGHGTRVSPRGVAGAGGHIVVVMMTIAARNHLLGLQTLISLLVQMRWTFGQALRTLLSLESPLSNRHGRVGVEARPREEVLAEKGLDYKKLDSEIEARKSNRPTSASSSRPPSAHSVRSEAVAKSEPIWRSKT